MSDTQFRFPVWDWTPLIEMQQKNIAIIAKLSFDSLQNVMRGQLEAANAAADMARTMMQELNGKERSKRRGNKQAA